MGFRSFIKKLIYPESYTEEVYISTLRNKYKINIGENCKIWSPNQVFIDKTRPHLLHIGNEVKITRNVTILCHDYSRSVLCSMEEYGNVGEGASTWIGDNVFIGVNSTILMGTHIGDNSIIGAGAVVSGIYPDGVVIAGNPAKIICTIEEYFQKRKSEEIQAAQEYAIAWKEKYNRWPDILEMTNAFSWLYLPHNENTLKQYDKLFNLSGVNRKKYIRKFLITKPVFNSYEKFIESCEKSDSKHNL